MICRRLLSTIIFITLLFFSTLSSAQSNSNNALVDSATHAALKFYTASIASSSHLYNGVEFTDYYIHIYDIGYPFFRSDDWQRGEIDYDGQHYQNVYILYDLVRDKVVIEHPFAHFKLELIGEKVKRFTIYTEDENASIAEPHFFVRLVADSTNQLVTGFYEVLYDGSVKVYNKPKKVIQTSLDMRVEITEYKEKSQLYIFKNGTHFAVKSKSSVLKIFSDRKATVRKFISENKIKFRSNRGYAVAQCAKVYDNAEK